MPINPMYFKRHRRDVMLVSLAGPGSNLILAILGIMRILCRGAGIIFKDTGAVYDTSIHNIH